jgi:hypothetical protein
MWFQVTLLPNKLMCLSVPKTSICYEGHDYQHNDTQESGCPTEG